MDHRLQRELRPVARRFRNVRLWWMLTCFWLVMAAVACWLWVNRAAFVLPNESIVLLAAAFIGAATLVVIALVSYRNLHWIAHEVEDAFPNLNERLLTAIEIPPREEKANYGYLQHVVIQETLRHARTHRWPSVVPFRYVALSQICNWGAFALMFVLLATLFASPLPKVEQQVAVVEGHGPSNSMSYDVTVEPGDTEIEKGTQLLVLARFAGKLPPDATLVVSPSTGDEAESEQRRSMDRTLDDPLFAGYVKEVVDDLTYHVEFADIRSETYSVRVFEYPLLVQADAHLHYPSYTQMEDKVIRDARRVSAVEGTELTWTCHLNKRVQGAFLHDKEGNEIELFAKGADPLAYSATIPLVESKRWTLYLVDADYRENKSPPELVAKVLKNKPAEMKLALARDVRVSPVEELEVQATTWDDFGLARYGLTYNIAGQANEDVVLGEAAHGKEHKDANYLLDFESLDAAPDQLLSYYFWADDYGPNGETRRTMSDMFFAEVRHFEEIFRQGDQPPGGQQQQQQQQSENEQNAEKLAELQKQIVTGTWNVIRRETGAQPSEKFGEDVRLLLESQQTAIEQAETLAEELTDAKSKAFIDDVRQHMTSAIAELTRANDTAEISALKPALNAEQAAYQALLRLRAREHEVVKSQQSQSQSQSQQSQQQQQRFQQQLQQLELKNDENRYETERQAQQQEDAQQREMRQVVNRLKELARRQEDLNEQVKQLQSALQEAETEEEREKIEEQLKRLRDQQQQILRDTDELVDRMDSEQNQEQMQEAREQLEETRENVQEASDALEKGDVPQALSAGTRAERELKDVRDELRKQSANQFAEEMREMRETARTLDDNQQKLSERLENMDAVRERNLRDKSERAEVADALNEQKEKLGGLLDRMKDTVEQAEESEPLLARKLYDSYRKTKQSKAEQALEATSELVNRGLDSQSREIEEKAGEGISELREDIEEAAEGVLGDEAEALRRAASELERLSQELNDEIARATGQGRPSDAQADDANEGANGQRPSDPQDGQPGEPAGNGTPQDPSERNGEARPNSGEPTENANDPQGQRPPQDGDQQRQPMNGESQQPGEGQQQPREGEPNGQGRSPQEPQDRPPTGQQPGSGQPNENQPNDGQRPEDAQPQSAQPNQQQPPNDSQQPGQGQPQPNSPPPQSPQSQGQTPGGQQPGEQPRSQQPGQQGQPGQQQGRPQSSGEPRDGQRGQQADGGGLRQFANDSRGSAPITGGDFRDWTDRLRDVEEMIEDPELAAEAARIRDRAKNFRVEFNRTGGEPKWRLVEEMVAEPLQVLQQEVANELLRRSASKNELVPIDRDPVPDQYEEQVRKYYERLGVGQ